MTEVYLKVPLGELLASPRRMVNVRLWSVEVGSRAWHMEHEGSDYDHFDCYIVPTQDILAGRVAPGGCHVSTVDNVDTQSHEVQRWVQEVVKGNLNYVVAVYSPIVYQDYLNHLAGLRDLLRTHPSTAIFASAKGMALHGLSRSEKHAKAGDDRRAWKNLRTAMRSLDFAEELMLTNTPMLRPYNFPDVLTLTEAQGWVKNELRTLEATRDASRFPSRPDSAPFEEFLLKLRLANLAGEGP